MNTGRTPAYGAKTLLHGDCAAISVLNKPHNVREDNLKNTENQAKKSGNRCGHDKHNFKRCTYPSLYKKRSHAIEEALRRLKKCEGFPYLYHSTTGLHWHAADKGGRKRRSESREAIIALVLSALIKGSNLIEMQFGIYDRNLNFTNYTYQNIKEVTNLSISRIKSAMKELQKLSLCTVKVIVDEYKKDKYRTKKVDIRLSEKIFDILDLKEEFLKDRRYSLKHFQKKQHQLNLRKSYLETYRPKNNLPRKNKESTHNIKKEMNNLPFKRPIYFIKKTIAQDKHVLDIAAKIMADNPGMPLKEAIQMASERNKAPPN